MRTVLKLAGPLRRSWGTPRVRRSPEGVGGAPWGEEEAPGQVGAVSHGSVSGPGEEGQAVCKLTRGQRLGALKGRHTGGSQHIPRGTKALSAPVAQVPCQVAVKQEALCGASCKPRSLGFHLRSFFFFFCMKTQDFSYFS